MCLNVEEREMVGRMLQVESAMDEANLKLGWSWQQVGIWPAKINKLIVQKIVRLGYSSNSCTQYRVTKEAKLAFEAYQEPVPVEPEIIDT